MMNSRAAACAVLGLLASLLVGTAQAAAGAVPTCHGQQATIVGGPDEDVVGTAGADVIVATDSASVAGLAGDDIICLLTTVQTLNTITAGDGDDYVEGQFEGDDSARLGDGDDELVYRGQPDTKQLLSGGRGLNTLTLDEGGSWLVNTRQDHLWIIDYGDTANLEGFTEFVVGTEASVGFVGGAADERVTVHGEVFGQLGGGDDFVELTPTGSMISFLGQVGRDRLLLSAVADGQPPLRARARLDLPAEQLRISGDLELNAAVSGVEEVTIAGVRRVRMIGDASANRFQTVGVCNSRLLGGAGSDALRVKDPACEMVGARLFGGSGRDRLVGSDYADLLDGGPGRDVADGRDNTDRCLAEVRRRCELR